MVYIRNVSLLLVFVLCQVAACLVPLAPFVVRRRAWPKEGKIRVVTSFLFSSKVENNDFGSLRDLLLPSTTCRVDQMSSTDLAYIGDAVYELVVRSSLVWPPKRTNDLQNQVVNIVRGTIILFWLLFYMLRMARFIFFTPIGISINSYVSYSL